MIRITGQGSIGSGKLGRVYAGLGLDGEKLIVKLVAKAGQERITREWKIYKRLKHSHLDGRVVPRCFGLYEHQDFSMLVMEWVGHSFSSLHDLSQLERYVG